MLTVLEMIAQEGSVSAAVAARMCDINRTVAHRLLATLAKHSFIRRAEKGYVLGPSLARLGRIAETGLKEIASPYMTKLAQSTGETVVLHGIDRLDAIVLDQALGYETLFGCSIHQGRAIHSVVARAAGPYLPSSQIS
jgi:IclR family pca regulon transcriptional regulator